MPLSLLAPGCATCWAKADRKVQQGDLVFVERAFVEPRFSVVLRRCGACAQDFARVHCTLSRFTADRDDTGSQSIPLSTAEVELLRGAASRGEPAVAAFLTSLSPREHTVETGGPVWLIEGAIKLLPHD